MRHGPPAGPVLATPTAVLAPRGLFRQGLCALLRESSVDVLEVGPDGDESLTEWWSCYGPGVADTRRLGEVGAVLCLVDSVLELPILDQLATGRLAHARVVALVPADAIEVSVQAMDRGARAVIAINCRIDELLASLTAAEHGIAVAPHAVVRTMADPRSTAPTTEEIGWLQELARGATVAQVARKAGLAERSFYRRLRQVYRKVDRDNRTEALLEARHRGLL